MMMKNFLATRRYQLRWAILAGLYSTRFEQASDSVLHSMLHSQWQATMKEIRAELDYLANAKLLMLERNAVHWQSNLTWHGVDFVEYTVDDKLDGIARPDDCVESSAERHLRFNLRGCILDTLTAANELGLNEGAMLNVINMLDKTVTIAKLRLELCYLADRGLISIDTGNAYWVTKLTNFGTDVFLGTVSLLPGIALRPDCYST